MNQIAAAPVRPAGLWRRVVPFWLGFAAIYLIYRWPFITGFRQADPDDTLRLVQVRDLLAGQGWFDLVQHRVNPPTGVVMHWSRLVDMPLAATELALRPLLGAALAEQATAAIVPLGTFLVLLLLVGRIVRRMIGAERIGYAMVLAGTAFPMITQIMPTRVDHHGWQIVAALGALLGLTDPRARRGGIIAGASLALGMAISLELLPLAVLFGAVAALGWVRQPGEPQRFTAFAVTLGMTSLAAFALTRGPDLRNWCDAVSPGYLAALAVVSGGVPVTAALARGSLVRILAGLALTGAAAAAALVAIAPACLAGPFGNLDPLLRHVWLDNVLEGLPVWTLDHPALAQWVIPPLAALGAAIHLWRQAEGAERERWLTMVLILAGSLALGVIVLRSMAFAIAFALVPLAWLVHRLKDRLEHGPGVLAKAGSLAALLIVVMPALPVYFIDTVMGVSQDAEATDAGAAASAPASGDERAAAAALAHLPQGTVFAPLDEGPWILLHTPHSVVATGHHRGAVAMHDVMTAFIVDPPVARTILARHGVRYVLVAPGSNELQTYAGFNPTGLAATLGADRTPDWLTPIALPAGSAKRLYAVNLR